MWNARFPWSNAGQPHCPQPCCAYRLQFGSSERGAGQVRAVHSAELGTPGQCVAQLPAGYCPSCPHKAALPTLICRLANMDNFGPAQAQQRIHLHLPQSQCNRVWNTFPPATKTSNFATRTVDRVMGTSN
jgi:hypothetical protein